MSMPVTFIVELKDGNIINFRYTYRNKVDFQRAYQLLDSVDDVVYISVKFKSSQVL